MTVEIENGWNRINNRYNEQIIITDTINMQLRNNIANWNINSRKKKKMTKNWKVQEKIKVI